MVPTNYYHSWEVPASHNQISTPCPLQTMDMKSGGAGLSLSTNPNCSGLFNAEHSVDLDEMDYDGSIIEPLPVEIIDSQMEGPFVPQLDSTCEDLLNSSTVSPSLVPVADSFDASSPESNINMSSSSLRDDNSVFSPDFDLFSALLDEDAPLDQILEQIEDFAIKQSQQNQQIQSVQLDHDYFKKEACTSTISDHPSTSLVSPFVRKVTPNSSSHGRKKDQTETVRRIRNNEASRRSRALKKQRFKVMENDVQRLVAENQRMRVLLKDMDITAKRCKELLVSSLSGKKLPFS